MPITRTSMRLLTKTGYKGGGHGVNGQGMTQPLEVVQRPRFSGLGYTEGECSKVSETPKKLLKLLRKENNGNTLTSSHRSAHCIGRAEASSHNQNHTRDSQERYSKSRYSRVHFD